MGEDFRWWVWGAGVCAVALAVALGPLVAGFAHHPLPSRRVR
jgi:hypothetical protein